MTLEIPTDGLVDEYSIYRRKKPTVTLAVRREVVAPVLFRNTATDRSETVQIDGELRAQVNPEKFLSKERHTGLSLIRTLDDQFDGGLISDYTYNEPGSLESVTNMDPLVYGVAGTGDAEYAFKSHVFAGYTFSTDEYDLMNKETRNAVYESGTMKDDEMEASSSLYERVNVQPGNSFVHFITLEAGTPAMLLYVLHNLLNTACYGARESRTARTLRNELLGVIVSDANTSLATYEFLSDHYNDDTTVPEGVSRYIADVERNNWTVFGDALPNYPDEPDWFTDAREVASRRREDSDEILYEHFRSLTSEARDVLLDN